MKLLCLSLAVIGAFAVHNREEAVGTHKVHGNVALLDGNGNTVKASCGEPDRRGKLTHGRTEWVNGVKTCVDWNPGTTGGASVTRECDKFGMTCCEKDEVLMEHIDDSDTLECNRDVPMCMRHSDKAPGYVTFEPTRCNLGDGTVAHCGNDVICCDEGSNDIHFTGCTYECRYIQYTPDPTTPPPVVVEEEDIEGCDPNFKDIDGDGCAAYVDGDSCDEDLFEEYANAKGVTAAVCPQCGCTDSSLFYATWF